MTAFVTKLRRRLARDSDLTLWQKLRDVSGAASRYVVHSFVATYSLRQCDKVGAWARTAGGPPMIRNSGHIELGAHVLLTSTFSPVQLTAGDGGSIRLGDRTVVNFGTIIAARKDVTVGEDVSIGPYCIISDSGIEGSGLSGSAAEPIEIGNGVWLAARVTVLPGSRIGNGAVVTAGSIVSGEIPAGTLAGGNPARVLRSIAAGEIEEIAKAEPALPGAESAAASAHGLALVHSGAYSSVQGSANSVVKPQTQANVEVAAAPKAPVRSQPSLPALVIADFTADDFAARLSEDTEAPFLAAEVAAFGQVHQTLLALSASETKPELVVVWARPETCIQSFQRLLEFEPVAESELLADVDAYADLLARALADVRCAVVPNWTMPWYHRGSGLADTRKGGATRALMAMNARLLERLDAHSNIHVLNAQRWSASGGRPGQSPKLWYLGKIAFGGELVTEAVKDVKAAFRAVLGGGRKLVVVDLDDTMWGGIVGDAGWENLRLGGHDGMGEAFVDFQRALKNLKRRGIVLAIASKNEESVALEAIRNHPEMVLREDDFVTWRINWIDKARNIAEMAGELNLGLQSIVFLDDNPVERARVREALPEVFVPEMPEDKLLYAQTLLNLACFDALSVTDEDLGRTEMYVAERKRNSLMPQIGSVDEWNSALQIKVSASRLAPANIARAVQLLNKTNQLNLSTRRLTQTELQTWVSDSRRELWVIRVSDRFGDYGLTGMVSVEAHASTAHIVDYLLSCRVMGRKVEEALVHVAVEAARARGLTRVEAHYVPTAKNKPCLDFWRRSGFEQADELLFVWDASTSYECPRAITLVREEGWENDGSASISECVS